MREFWITLVNTCSIHINLKDGQFRAEGLLGVVALLLLALVIGGGFTGLVAR